MAVVGCRKSTRHSSGAIRHGPAVVPAGPISRAPLSGTALRGQRGDPAIRIVFELPCMEGNSYACFVDDPEFGCAYGEAWALSPYCRRNFIWSEGHRFTKTTDSVQSRTHAETTWKSFKPLTAWVHPVSRSPSRMSVGHIRMPCCLKLLYVPQHYRWEILCAIVMY